MGSLLAELARWVVDVVHSFGYVGVFVVVLLGSLYLPVPTELTLPLFGFLVGQGWVAAAAPSVRSVGVCVFARLGSLSLPVPTELTLPLFGFLVGQGRLTFVPVVLTATAARVGAAMVFYALGLRIGEARLRRLIGRAERTKLVYGSDLERGD